MEPHVVTKLKKNKKNPETQSLPLGVWKVKF